MAEELIKISIDQEESFYIENGDYDKTLRTIIQEHKNKEKNGNVLQLKSVQDICDGPKNFYIADYQRGYRWGKDEVEALLNDIYEVYKKDDSGQKYCLQPLVVTENKECAFSSYLEKDGVKEKKSKKACYELLDGQQRLTTIFLIIEKILQLIEEERNTYQIYYELVRPIDREFIANTIKREKGKRGIIEQWFCGKSDFNSNYQDVYLRKKGDYEQGDFKNPNWQKKELKNYLNVIYTKLVFIWYEVKEDVSEELFRKINKGKIELTNAELFKAMLLNDENAANEEDRRELERISFEWDKIEQSLRNDEFWFFISNDHSEERTRIDYILEVYARSLDKEKKYSIEKERYSFLVVQDNLNKKSGDFNSIKELWKEIVSIHDKLYSWYQDNELYHNIGFLVACEGKTRAAASEIIVDLFVCEGKVDIKRIRQDVRGKIKEQFCQIAKKIKNGKENESTDNIDLKDLIASIDYNNVSKADLREILLYSNIFPIIKVFKKFEESKKKAKEAEKKTNGDIDKSLQKSLNEIFLERFPFKKYYQIDWDIEHINPKEPIKEIEKAIAVFEDEKEKEVYKNAIIDYLTAKGCNGKKLEEDPNLLQQYWEKNSPKDGKDDIGNLVLLDSSTNRQYHNAIFGYKRSCIIQREKIGKYVLPQTRKVFLKYDDAKPELIEWNENNQKEYEEVFVEMINFIDIIDKDVIEVEENNE